MKPRINNHINWSNMFSISDKEKKMEPGIYLITLEFTLRHISIGLLIVLLFSKQSFAISICTDLSVGITC